MKKIAKGDTIMQLLRFLARRKATQKHIGTVKGLTTQNAKMQEKVKELARMAKIVGGIGVGTTGAAGGAGYMLGRNLHKPKETSADRRERMVKRAGLGRMLRWLLPKTLAGGGIISALRSRRVSGNLGKMLSGAGRGVGAAAKPVERAGKRIGKEMGRAGGALQRGGGKVKRHAGFGKGIAEAMQGEGGKLQDKNLYNYLIGLANR